MVRLVSVAQPALSANDITLNVSTLKDLSADASQLPILSGEKVRISLEVTIRAVAMSATMLHFRKRSHSSSIMSMAMSRIGKHSPSTDYLADSAGSTIPPKAEAI